MEDHPDFCLEALPLPEVFPENETGMLTLMPGQHDTDGFFICQPAEETMNLKIHDPGGADAAP